MKKKREKNRHDKVRYDEASWKREREVGQTFNRPRVAPLFCGASVGIHFNGPY